MDVEVWLNASNVESFLEALSGRYLVSEEEARAAVASSAEFRSIQALDLEPLLKFDCFVKSGTPWEEETYQAGKEVELDSVQIRMACAEHIVVQKLRWYELGNRVSERQWMDLLEVKRVAALDWDLIERWAKPFGLDELVKQLKQA